MQSKNINTLINLITQIKEKEIIAYKKKLIYLKHLINIHPNDKLYANRYQITRVRFENLMQTFKQLKYLEINLKTKK